MSTYQQIVAFAKTLDDDELIIARRQCLVRISAIDSEILRRRRPSALAKDLRRQRYGTTVYSVCGVLYVLTLVVCLALLAVL